MEPKPYHRLGRLSPDTGRYNIIIGAGCGIWHEAIC
jgi:hypothetical protein